LALAQGGQVRRQFGEELHVVLPTGHRVCAKARPDGEQGLRQRMPSLLGWNFGPEQIDQPIPRDRPRAPLEMQVKQNGQMFFGSEGDGRMAAAHELGRSENLELKQP